MGILLTPQEIGNAIGYHDISLIEDEMGWFQDIAKDQVRKVAEWIKTKAWQGHKPSMGFDRPKGYLVREEDLQQLLKEAGL